MYLPQVRAGGTARPELDRGFLP